MLTGTSAEARFPLGTEVSGDFVWPPGLLREIFKPFKLDKDLAGLDDGLEVGEEDSSTGLGALLETFEKEIPLFLSRFAPPRLDESLVTGGAEGELLTMDIPGFPLNLARDGAAGDDADDDKDTEVFPSLESLVDTGPAGFFSTATDPRLMLEFLKSLLGRVLDAGELVLIEALS